MNSPFRLEGDFTDINAKNTFVYIDIFYDENGKPFPYEEHLKRAKYQETMDNLR